MATNKCLHRFDTGFVPTAKSDRDAIIVTRNARAGEYRIWGGSFIGAGGCREASVDEAAEYLSRSPHWAHLMRLTLQLGWHDVHRALGRL